MNNIFKMLVLFIIVVLSSCGSDDTSDTTASGNLLVSVRKPNGSPEPNASVIIMPNGRTVLTDASGIASFQNLEIGTYSVLVELSTSSEFYVEGVTIVFDDVVIVENETETLSVELLDGPQPIEEADLDIDFLLADTYAKLRDAFLFDLGGYSMYWGDIGADIAYVNNTSPSTLFSLDRYIFEPSNSIINEVWAIHYRSIRNTNVGLEAITNGEYTSNVGKEENLVQAEFRFLRALLYFNLLKLYGNPVLVSNTSLDVPFLQNRAGLIDLIEEDLVFAEINLENYTTSKVASIQAAQILLGRFYMYLAGFPELDSEKYNLAALQFEKVLNQFNLEANYSNIFNVDNESGNTEVIFSIDFDVTEEQGGGNVGVFWGPLGYSLQDYLLLDPKFIREFFLNEANVQNPVTFPLAIEDKRFYSNVAPFTVQNGLAMDATNTADWRPLKYIGDVTMTPSQYRSSEDFPYMRYADVLLMLAEAENAVNGPTARAYELVNQVIDRSHTSNDFQLENGLNQDEFLSAILEQRRKELCFEGSYKDDLIRNELLSAVIEDFNLRNPDLAKEFAPHKYVWPIPQSEINTNPNIIQNMGY